MPKPNSGAIRLILAHPLKLPSRQAEDFLLDALEPALEGLRERGLIRRWSLTWAVGSPRARSRLLLVDAAARTPGSAQALRRGIKTLLTPALKSVGGGFRTRYDPEKMIELRRRRFGGDRGVRIQELFRRRSTRLFLALARFARGASEQDRLGAALAAFLFYMDVFQVPADRVREGVERWLAFSPRLDPRARADPRAPTRPPGLEQSLRVLDWRAAGPVKLRALWQAHERDMRRIGRLLKGNAPHFHPDRPWLFTVFHSYLHTHYRRGGISGRLELLLLAFIQEVLAPRP